LIQTEKLGDEAEKLLKEAIAEYKQTSWQQRGKQLWLISKQFAIGFSRSKYSEN